MSLFFVRDFKNLIFENCSFDIVISSERFTILNSNITNTKLEETEQIAVLNEIYRVLKDNGRYTGYAIIENGYENATLELLKKTGFKDINILSEEIIDAESGELFLYIEQKTAEELNLKNKYLKRIIISVIK